MATSSTNLGRVALVPAGEYDPIAQYQRLDVVEHEGSSYLALRAVQGVTPAAGDDWMLLVRRGAPGQDGTNGQDGSSIVSIERTAGNGAPGTTDTYTVTLTDGSTSTFQVYNGKDGQGSGDMTKSVYDPQNKAQDIFGYVDEALKDIPAAKNTVTILGGAEMVPPAGLGPGPYEIILDGQPGSGGEKPPDEGSGEESTPPAASEVTYDGAESGLEATTVQGAVDELAAIKADAWRVNGRNLLHNWYFPRPVNQRGQNVYTGTGYTIDQWRVEGNLKVTLESGWLKLENETDDAHWFIQKAEHSLLKELSGHTVTHSVLCKGVGTNLAIYFGYDEGGEWKVPNGALIPTDGNVSVAQCTTVIPDTTDATNFQVFYFGIYPHSTLYIKAVKLELGPTQTLAHQDEYGAWILNDPPPDYGAELAKCQRYFERSVWNVSAATALSTSEIEFCGSYYFKVQKRGDVNITVGTGAQELLVYDTVTKQNITGVRALKPKAFNLGMFSPCVQDPQNRFVVGRLYQVIIPDWQYDISSEL